MILKINLFSLLLVCNLNYLTNGANILGLFTYPSKSHHLLGHSLLKALVHRGHNVTMISPFGVEKTIANYTHIEISEVDKFKVENYQEAFQENLSILQKLLKVPNLMFIYDILLNSTQVQNFLKSDAHFDVIIQFYPTSESLLGFSHFYNASVIGFLPVGGLPMLNKLTGNPGPTSYVPLAITTFTDNMSFFERVTNTMYDLGISIIYNLLLLPYQKRLLKKYFPKAPAYEELEENIDLILVNSHVSVESPRPYLPNIVQIGGFHLNEKEDIPNDLKQYLDDATEGVVYFSFGTNVKSSELSIEIKNIFLDTFRNLTLKVLWKFEEDSLPNKSDNVKIVKWLPQRAVLAHPNVKAFITHGGMGSTTEALHYGIPVICIPFFGDQYKNCIDTVNFGYGIKILSTELKESFSNALKEILQDDIYRKKAAFRSALFREQEMNPMDKAVFWVEHIIKHKGGKHLKSKARELPLWQYLLLDVIAFLFFVTLLCFIICFYIFKLCFKFICKRSQRKIKIS